MTSLVPAAKWKSWLESPGDRSLRGDVEVEDRDDTPNFGPGLLR